MSKALTKNRLLFLSCLLILAIPLAVMPVSVSAAVNISPDSGSSMLGIPNQFTVTGLNASRTYSVLLDDVSEQTALAPSTGGSIMFSVTFNSEGNHKVEVTDDDDSDTVVATASIYCQDIVLLITTLLSAILGIVIVVKVFEKVEDMF